MAPSKRTLAWCTLALAGGLPLGAGAEEKSNPLPAAPTSGESSIHSAKRDFDAVKSATNPALQEKGKLPSMGGMTELHTDPGVGSLLKQKKAPATEKKSNNWLLDAMEKQDARKDRERTGKSDRERPSSLFDREPSLLESERGEEGKERGDVRNGPEAQRKDVSGATNPLAPFLGEWMTAQDYTLLKPGLDQSLGKSFQSPVGGPVPTIGSVLPSVPGSDSLFAGISSPPRAATVIPKENPYLPALSAPAPVQLPGLQPSITAVPPIAPSLVPAPIGPPPPPATRSKIPDFAKPAQDEKYFKQLKRF